jgi:hypothetical protein
MALQVGHQFVQVLVETLGYIAGQMEINLGGGEVGMSQDFLRPEGTQLVIFLLRP